MLFCSPAWPLGLDSYCVYMFCVNLSFCGETFVVIAIIIKLSIKRKHSNHGFGIIEVGRFLARGTNGTHRMSYV